MCLQGIVPNEVTFVNILEACSHVGLIDEAYYYFATMAKQHGIVPGIEHYNCMVDLLGRAGRLEEAEVFIHRMPFYSTLLPWLSLLSACRFNMDVEVGKKAAHNIRVLEPESNVADALLANVHVALGQWEEASKLRLFREGNYAHTTHGVN
jgi:pentatricopeptide repeat protein